MELLFAAKSKIDDKGRVRIHPMLRKKLGLKAGCRVEWSINNLGQAVFRAAKPKYVKKRPI
ncbi:MAG: hypothetical protein EOP67_03340 [Sphingomonas sp.]|uniref:hypothetical protein n=1 Tax=Sphingomonas sp. CD22 TaxID=3100214 RepID=UPI00122A00EA|nr:hypothetical protein [Sphingomonas sp. CD22]MEA1084296.1 hypothetical protein [Sphingomonas sp. CD22]RZM37031.1 MAG: hypothetical protein EOP67_03340 [Sphingomonas sp.]